MSFEEVRAKEAGFEPPSDSSEPRTRKALRHCDWSASRRAGAGRRDALIQFLIDDLDRAIEKSPNDPDALENLAASSSPALAGRVIHQKIALRLPRERAMRLLWIAQRWQIPTGTHLAHQP